MRTGLCAALSLVCAAAVFSAPAAAHERRAAQPAEAAELNGSLDLGGLTGGVGNRMGAAGYRYGRVYVTVRRGGGFGFFGAPASFGSARSAASAAASAGASVSLSFGH